MTGSELRIVREIQRNTSGTAGAPQEVTSVTVLATFGPLPIRIGTDQIGQARNTAAAGFTLPRATIVQDTNSHHLLLPILPKQDLQRL